MCQLAPPYLGRGLLLLLRLRDVLDVAAVVVVVIVLDIEWNGMRRSTQRAVVFDKGSRSFAPRSFLSRSRNSSDSRASTVVKN